MRPEVWAPRAGDVAVVTGAGEQQMVPRGDGWFVAQTDLRPGERYAFRLDGGAPLPDPRAVWLPDGVHGRAAVVDPALLRRETGWTGLQLRGAALYELHVGAFTEAGTFVAAIEHLDHLVALGIEAVELMPVAAFPGGRGWGYDGVALYAADESYGGLAGLVRLVDACHERGLGVVIDVVHNHFGPEGNYLSEFGPYFTDRHSTPWGDAVNLDGPGCTEVRRFLLDSARHWLVDVGADGLRLDAVHALTDDSDLHFLAELSQHVARWADEAQRPLTLVAESDLNQPSTMAPAGSGPWAAGMDAQWADDVHHALHSFFSGERQGYYVDFGSAEVLAKALTRVFVHDGGLSTYRGQPWGAPVDVDSPHYDGHSFVVFLQNHDQVGNRAVGDRFATHASADLQAAAAALYLLGPFTPLVFMGEEWAASTPFPYFSHLGPELGPFVTEGRSREFKATGWAEATPDPQDERTWHSAKLRWQELNQAPHARMLRWYERLLELRRSMPELGSADLSTARVEIIDDDTVVLHRGSMRVAATRGPGREVQLGGRLLASWDDGADLGAGRYRLRGPGAVITG